MRSKIEKASIQFNYFSDNYKRFEEDFYKVANISIPLTFLTDDILKLMISTNKNYFKLNSDNAKDKKDHYFIFNKKENKNIKQFEYLRHSYSIYKND